jgi:hypothetical protein
VWVRAASTSSAGAPRHPRSVASPGVLLQRWLIPLAAVLLVVAALALIVFELAR